MSTREAANVFALGKDVALHSPFDLFFCSTSPEIQLGIEGVQFEEVAMGFAGGRTRPAVTETAKIVQALLRAAEDEL